VAIADQLLLRIRGYLVYITRGDNPH